jgi:hypothetical protein
VIAPGSGELPFGDHLSDALVRHARGSGRRQRCGASRERSRPTRTACPRESDAPCYVATLLDGDQSVVVPVFEFFTRDRKW